MLIIIKRKSDIRIRGACLKYMWNWYYNRNSLTHNPDTRSVLERNHLWLKNKRDKKWRQNLFFFNLYKLKDTI